MLPGEHIYTYTPACARFQLSMCFEVSICTPILQHVHASSWACACLQLSKCICTIQHVHAFSWAYACLQVSICTPTIQHVHVSSWACASLQVSICTYTLQHVHAFSWARARFHVLIFLHPYNSMALPKVVPKFEFSFEKFQQMVFKLPTHKWMPHFTEKAPKISMKVSAHIFSRSFRPKCF